MIPYINYSPIFFGKRTTSPFFCGPRWGLLTLVIQFVLFLGFVSAGTRREKRWDDEDVVSNGLIDPKFAGHVLRI